MQGFFIQNSKSIIQCFLCLSTMNKSNMDIEKTNFTWMANHSKSIKILSIIKFLSIEKTKIVFIWNAHKISKGRVSANFSCCTHFNYLKSSKKRSSQKFAFLWGSLQKWKPGIQIRKGIGAIQFLYFHLEFQRVVSDFPFSRWPRRKLRTDNTYVEKERK
jgi:hypothetical protein